MSNKIRNTNDYLGYLESIQDNLKYILSFIIVLNFIIIFLLKFSIRARHKLQNFFNNPKDQKEIKEILLIIAHPDDEIMFFYPSIKNFLKNNLKIRILCLSNGNFQGLGKIRESEFSQVMKKLKIEDFVILDDEKMKDDMKLKWNESYVAEQIKNYFLKEDGGGNNFEKIGSIITFDDFGVTKHPNHTSCCDGLIKFLKDNKDIIVGNKINSYLLDSFNPISQYTMIIPFLFFYFKEHGFFNFNIFNNWSLMKLHWSQFNLMRKLHIIFSSYTFFNTYTKLEFS